MGITSVSNKVGRVEKEEEAENSVTVDILKYFRIFLMYIFTPNIVVLKIDNA